MHLGLSNSRKMESLILNFANCSCLMVASNKPLLVAALHYTFEAALVPGVQERRRVPLYEDGWFIRRGSVQLPVSRWAVIGGELVT